jgi:hypothetical protein
MPLPARYNAFDLNDFFTRVEQYEEGHHAFYGNLGNNLGIKVGKPGLSEADPVARRIYREFLILKGIESTGLAPKAHCHGMVRLTHPKTHRLVVAPYILLEHIAGASPLDFLDLIINQHYRNSPAFSPEASYDARISWAFEHNEFAPHRAQYERIMYVMRNHYGLAMEDHEDNLSNFIIQDGLWKVIDFSCEDLRNINPKIKSEMKYRAAPFVNQSLPPEYLWPYLRKFLIK